VVGHTDATGGVDYTRALSQARAAAVVEALATQHGTARERLSAHGVGPIVPVFSNASEDGRGQNRRVELVERPD
jgi:outer membrane protein OmpA-like peptidoglycan-associated protein